MKRYLAILVAALFIVAASFHQAYGDEGMWLLPQIERLPQQKLSSMGMALKADAIYRSVGGGISEAVVQVGGGTGTFVSPQGLIITNHHVAFKAIQAASTKEQNHLDNGFSAQRLEDEIRAQGYEALITEKIVDVTDEVKAVLKPGMQPDARHKALQKRTKELVAKYESDFPGKRCRIEPMLEGTAFYLFVYDRLQDIRIVCAPPRCLGNFGGEVDNWMWPRHSCDYTFLRAYAGRDGSPAPYAKENVPYRPKVWLPISRQGAREGDFTMILGYPARTSRYRCSYSIAYQSEKYLPLTIDLLSRIEAILVQASQKDPDVKLRVAATLKSTQNGLKKSRGVLEGLRKTGLLRQKRKEESDFSKYLEREPSMKASYGNVLPALEREYDEMYRNWQRDLMLDYFMQNTLFRTASVICTWSREREKPDLERRSGYQDRDLASKKNSIESIKFNYDEGTDRAILSMLIREALSLPQSQRIAQIDSALGRNDREREQVIASFVDSLYRGTRLADGDYRMSLLSAKHGDLEKSGDPFIRLAISLEKSFDESRERSERFAGVVEQMRPLLIEGLAQWRKKDLLYPDANGTIRFTYGSIKGYSPRDAVSYNAFTTISGVLEKDQGAFPFLVPEKLKEICGKKDFGSYRDSALGTLPVDFIATCDITGGNSGSAVLNGKGEITALAFDGNWDSLASDFIYEPERTRTQCVDIRYILFITDRLMNAGRIMGELAVQQASGSR
jgi:hypothetical protein